MQAGRGGRGRPRHTMHFRIPAPTPPPLQASDPNMYTAGRGRGRGCPPVHRHTLSKSWLASSVNKCHLYFCTVMHSCRGEGEMEPVIRISAGRQGGRGTPPPYHAPPDTGTHSPPSPLQASDPNMYTAGRGRGRGCPPVHCHTLSKSWPASTTKKPPLNQKRTLIFFMF